MLDIGEIQSFIKKVTVEAFLKLVGFQSEVGVRVAGLEGNQDGVVEIVPFGVVDSVICVILGTLVDVHLSEQVLHLGVAELLVEEQTPDLSEGVHAVFGVLGERRSEMLAFSGLGQLTHLKLGNGTGYSFLTECLCFLCTFLA